MLPIENPHRPVPLDRRVHPFLPCPALAAEMRDDRRGVIDDLPAGQLRPPAEVHVFAVEVVLLVEAVDLVQHLSPHQ